MMEALSSEMRVNSPCPSRQKSVSGSPLEFAKLGYDRLSGLFSRGRRKRQRQQRIVSEHLRQNGCFNFRGCPAVVPHELCLSLQSIIASGDYEAAESDLIERYLPRDLPVIELGGCLGLVSGLVARRLSPHIQHVVVEPNPEILDVCWQNATQAGTRKNTQVVAKALGYGGEKVAFDLNRNVHVSKLSNNRRTANAIVDATTLRDLVDMLEARGDYTLICDIEGAEVALLEYDSKALANCALMILELHPEVYRTSGDTVEGVIDSVCSAGLVPIAQEGNVYAFRRSDVPLSAFYRAT